MNCEIFRSLTLPLKLPDSPPNYYISIDLITNTLTSLSRLLLASYGSLKIGTVHNEDSCLSFRTKSVCNFKIYLMFFIFRILGLK